MSDVFGQETTIGPSFKASLASFTFGNLPTVGLIVQNLGAQYQMPVTRIWELGVGNRTYFIAGRTSGGLGLARVVGPTAIGDEFQTNFMDICKVAENNMRINAMLGFCENGRAVASNAQVNRLIKGVVINAISMNFNSQDMTIQDQLSGVFVSLQKN